MPEPDAYARPAAEKQQAPHQIVDDAPQGGTLRPIHQIIVGKRFRRDHGDIDGLAASIDAVGLLQPIVITPDGVLLCGERRLLAAKRLGWTEIPVTIRRPR